MSVIVQRHGDIGMSHDVLQVFGVHPSVQIFLKLMSRYHISVDQILHGETMEGKSTERMQFETLLDELTDAEIKILTATAQALLDARTDNEGEN